MPEPLKVRTADDNKPHTLHKRGQVWRCDCCTLEMSERDVCTLLIHGEAIGTQQKKKRGRPNKHRHAEGRRAK